MDGTKASANLAGLLALPGRIGEFSCMPPHNEEEKPLDPHELSTTGAKNGLVNFRQTIHGVPSVIQSS